MPGTGGVDCSVLNMALDRATLDEFVAGSPHAIRAVYAAFNKQVFTVTMSMLGNRALAEEATQQTFIKAWRRAETFDPTRPIGAWLYSIARRASIDVYRRERRHDHVEAQTDQAAEEPSFEHTWDAWQLRTALEGLRQEDRETLRAVYFEGLSHDQAAKRLGIARGTVKSRVHRAQVRLADALAHLREDGS